MRASVTFTNSILCSKLGLFSRKEGCRPPSCNGSGRAALTSPDSAAHRGDTGTDLEEHVVRVLVSAGVRVGVSPGGRKQRILRPDMHGNGIVAKRCVWKEDGECDTSLIEDFILAHLRVLLSL